MRILVGSMNPVKINAVKAVMSRINSNAEIIPLEVDSGVSKTPFGEDQIVQGALNRARNAFEHASGDFAIGMEGGIVTKFERFFLTGWCAVLDNAGNYQFGCGVYMPIAEKIVEMVKTGMELGAVIDQLTGIRDTKYKMGSIGILTNNLMTRQQAWEDAIIYAMVVKISPPGIFTC